MLEDTTIIEEKKNAWRTQWLLDSKNILKRDACREQKMLRRHEGC